MRYHEWFHSEQERTPPAMSPAATNSFGSETAFQVEGKSYHIFRLDALEKKKVGQVSRLPFSLKVLLENLLRQEDGRLVRAADIEALARWAQTKGTAASQKEIAFMPARVLLQDFKIGRASCRERV